MKMTPLQEDSVANLYNLTTPQLHTFLAKLGGLHGPAKVIMYLNDTGKVISSLIFKDMKYGKRIFSMVGNSHGCRWLLWRICNETTPEKPTVSFIIDDRVPSAQQKMQTLKEQGFIFMKTTGNKQFATFLHPELNEGYKHQQ